MFSFKLAKFVHVSHVIFPSCIRKKTTFYRYKPIFMVFSKRTADRSLRSGAAALEDPEAPELAERRKELQEAQSKAQSAKAGGEDGEDVFSLGFIVRFSCGVRCVVGLAREREERKKKKEFWHNSSHSRSLGPFCGRFFGARRSCKSFRGSWSAAKRAHCAWRSRRLGSAELRRGRRCCPCCSSTDR